MTAKQLHPAYDIKTKTWFVEGIDSEAPTLRELKNKLGKKFKFLDYYPNGYLRSFSYSNEVTRKHFTSSAQSTQWIRRPAKEDKPKRKRPTTSNPASWRGWNDENVAHLKELYKKGLAGTAIGNELGCTRNTAIAKIHRLKLRG